MHTVGSEEPGKPAPASQAVRSHEKQAWKHRLYCGEGAEDGQLGVGSYCRLGTGQRQPRSFYPYARRTFSTPLALGD